MVSDIQRARIKQLLTWNRYQLPKVELAARCGYTLEQWVAIESEWPELKELEEQERLNGLSDLRQAFFDRALVKEDFGALRALSRLYLALDLDPSPSDASQKHDLFRQTLSQEQLDTMWAFLNPSPEVLAVA